MACLKVCVMKCLTKEVTFGGQRDNIGIKVLALHAAVTG